MVTTKEWEANKDTISYFQTDNSKKADETFLEVSRSSCTIKGDGVLTVKRLE